MKDAESRESRPLVRVRTEQRTRVKTVSLVMPMLFGAVLAGVLGRSWAQQPAPGAADQKDLYFLVVDNSQSMGSLVNPVRGALVECVGKLPANTEVRLVFFDDRASRVKTWLRMDLAAKGDFSEFAHANFKPSGQTRLYDTVAEVFQSVARESASFRTVRIIVLSDGDDNQSRTCRSWADVERLADLRLLQNRRDTFISLYTLGPDWNPKDQPSADSCINVYAVPQADKLDLRLDAPSARFTAYPGKANVEEAVSFELMSPSGIAEAVWSFGDGTTSTDLNPRHPYGREGTYDVSVHVRGPGGEDDSTRKAYILVAREIPLEARFRWTPEPARVGEPVQFLDESLGGATSWVWTIEGIGQKEDRNPAATFDAAGTFGVLLTVRKGEVSRSLPQKVRVLPPPPDASVSCNPANGQLELGQTAQLSATATSPDCTHTWVIGDNVVLKGPKVEWKADRRGRVDFVHIVESHGERREWPGTLFIEEPLVARMRWVPEEVRAGEPVQFMSECAGGPQAYHWDFPGTGTKDEPNPKVVFAQEGTVKVVLTITRDGKSVSTPPTGIVVKPPLPDADFTPEPDAVVLGQSVRLTARRTEAGWTHTWKAGDREIGTGDTVTFTPPASGWVVVMHEVRGTGGTNQATKKVFVEKEPAKLVTASFDAGPTTGRGTLDVRFTDTSRGEVAGWSWDFGDGDTSDERNPTHRYRNRSRDIQTFTPRLVVRNSKGEGARDSGEVRVTVKPPLALWVRALVVLAAALLVWTTAIVPLILKPTLAPQAGVRLQSTKVHVLRTLAGKHISGIFWPRSYVTIGSRNEDDIHVGGVDRGGQQLAQVRRMPASDGYVIVATKAAEVQAVPRKSESPAPSQDAGAAAPAATEPVSHGATAAPITSPQPETLGRGKPRLLRDGDQYAIRGTTITWANPAEGRQSAKTRKRPR